MAEKVKREFIVDFMCGKLARWLRFMGIDTLYVKETDPVNIETLSLKTKRIIVTRSTKLTNRKRIKLIVLKEENLEKQIMELNSKINIRKDVKLLGRCSLCNTPLKEAKKDIVKGKVPPYVFKTQDKFLKCPNCKKIYWKGTHYHNIKKRIEGILASLIIILLLFGGCAKRMLYETNSMGIPIARILIADELTSVSLFSSNNIIATSPKHRFNIGPFDTFTIKAKGNLCFPISFEPRYNSPIFLNGIGYPGRIKVYLDGSLLNIVNLVDMETYLKGVVPQELGPRTKEEIEAVKAQAVAARTYAFMHLDLKRKPCFDLLSTVSDQVYKGTENQNPISDRAVEETYGEVITYKGKPIEAKYSSTCGGRTSDATDNWGEEDIPYLRSIKDIPKFSHNEDDAFCKSSPLFKWQKGYKKEDFYNRLIRNLRDIDSTLSNKETGDEKMLIIERNPRSKRVRTMKIKTAKNEFVIEKFDIRRVLKDDDKILFSNYFYIEDNGDSVIIKGRGAGHGCGMCQWGAIGMARRGYDYYEILKHYYRGTSVQKMY